MFVPPFPSVLPSSEVILRLAPFSICYCVYLFPQFHCIYVSGICGAFFALVAGRNTNWSHFLPGLVHTCLFPCPLFLFVPSGHYLANLFVVIPSLFHSVHLPLCLSWCVQSAKYGCVLSRLLFCEDILPPNLREEPCVSPHVHLLI